jgi:hypothetical protein
MDIRYGTIGCNDSILFLKFTYAEVHGCQMVNLQTKSIPKINFGNFEKALHGKFWLFS